MGPESPGPFVAREEVRAGASKPREARATVRGEVPGGDGYSD
jgi:hypothetical protein